MFSHIYISVNNFTQAMALYEPLLQGLQLTRRRYDPQRPWAVWESPGQRRPFFIVGLPFDGQSHDPGRGQMVAFMASSRAQVDRAYALAMSQGCKDEGAPGLRPHYHDNYYGAYFRDHAGNKLCVVCHEPPSIGQDEN